MRTSGTPAQIRSSSARPSGPASQQRALRWRGSVPVAAGTYGRVGQHEPEAAAGDRGEQVAAPHVHPRTGQPAVDPGGGDRAQRQVDGGDGAGTGLCGGDGQRAAAGADVEDVAVAGEAAAAHDAGEQLGVGLGAVDTGGIQHHGGLCALARSRSNLVRHTPVTRVRAPSSGADGRRAQAGRGDDPGPVAVRLLELQHRGDGTRVVEGAQGGDGGVRGQVGEPGDRRRDGLGVGRGPASSGASGAPDPGRCRASWPAVCAATSRPVTTASAAAPATCPAASDTCAAAPRPVVTTASAASTPSRGAARRSAVSLTSLPTPVLTAVTVSMVRVTVAAHLVEGRPARSVRRPGDLGRDPLQRRRLESRLPAGEVREDRGQPPHRLVVGGLELAGQRLHRRHVGGRSQRRDVARPVAQAGAPGPGRPAAPRPAAAPAPSPRGPAPPPGRTAG